MASVTVIVPSYNHASYLSACLDSVIGQTFTDWSLLLVDDGSTDDSVAVAQTYAARDPRIRVAVNERNLGTYGTLQKCLDMTESAYVAVLNSDDFWHPDKLARQVAALEARPEATFSYVLGWKADESGVIDESEDVHANWPTEPDQDLFPYLLRENRILASGVLFRRAGLRFETSCRYSGDHIALIEACWRGPAVCVPERLTFWRMHSTNSFTISEKQMLEEVRLREAIMRETDRWRASRTGSELVDENIAANAHNLFAVYALFGYRGRLGSLVPFMLGHAATRRRGIKRLMSAFLPKRYVRSYFWGHTDADKTFSFDFARFKQQIEAQPPLHFKLDEDPASRSATS
ncbi:MAG: glycosyltransferase [Armatimonadetes bacterium]|nr:glycosyltransferase [Armatimonadota bacterium]